ncbi:hypothetical protein GCM10010221_55990 [Streptomyces parvus]|nr:hypothetical protein GCM10010221_55990 [Streptomyces parvus]
MKGATDEAGYRRSRKPQAPKPNTVLTQATNRMMPTPLQSSEASASASRSGPSKRRDRPSSGSTGTAETQTMKVRASRGAARRVNTLDTPQQAAAPTTRTNARTGPPAPSSTAATAMPARATAMPATRIRPGRSERARAANRAVKTAWIWRTREESPAGIPWSMPMNRSPNFPTPRTSPTPTTHFQATEGRPRRKIAGTAAARKRSAEKRSGGKWSSPSSITTKFTPQSAATSTARAIWRGRMRRAFSRMTV